MLTVVFCDNLLGIVPQACEHKLSLYPNLQDLRPVLELNAKLGTMAAQVHETVL